MLNKIISFAVFIIEEIFPIFSIIMFVKGILTNDMIAMGCGAIFTLLSIAGITYLNKSIEEENEED